VSSYLIFILLLRPAASSIGRIIPDRTLRG